nr:MAG TPA: antitoxin [Caudoviricetes sp.]
MLTALKTPDFFTRENRPATDEIHDILRAYLACATDTMTVEVDADLLMLVEKVLKIYGWTVEESLVLYLMWCITCPDDMEAWLSNTDERTVKTDEENANPI